MKLKTTLILLATLALASLPAAAETFDLYIHSFCSAGSHCGSPSETEYRLKLQESVQHMNRQWYTAGISFRPVIFPIQSNNPLALEVTGCNQKDKRNPYACSNDENLVCTVDAECIAPGICEPQKFCEDMTTTCLDDTDCAAADDLCYPLNTQRRLKLRDQFAVGQRDAITMLLFEGQNTCCANIPDADDTDDNLSAIYCDAASVARRTGSVFTHEMGHYWCLGHVFTAREWIDEMMDPDHDGDNLADTAADPQVPESEDRRAHCVGFPNVGCRDDGDCNIWGGSCDTDVWVEGHDFCEKTVIDGTDPGSYFPSYCTSDCQRCLDDTCGQEFNGNLISIPYDPDQHNALSYWGYSCRAPFSVGGQPFQPFSTQQIGRIHDCRVDWQRRIDLVDICLSAGGDLDHDGICQNDDNCPQAMNTSQVDQDGDGDGDACDLCPMDPAPTGDLDGDGIGDACDPDRDNDGCDNDVDQNPDEAMQDVGTFFLQGPCESDQATNWGFTGGDADGDGVLDCEDVDDDNDFICDEDVAQGPSAPGTLQGCAAGPDVCPTIPGAACADVVPGNDCIDPWLACIGGGCNEYYSLLAPISNPDPSAVLRLDDIFIYNQTLYTAAPAFQTPATTAMQMSGAFNIGGFASGGEEQYQLELWRNGDTTPQAILIEAFTLSEVVLGDISAGQLLSIEEYIGDVVREIRIGTVWGPGVVAADDDDDNTPTFADNCKLLHNPYQRDNDGDGFGNLCDGDIDNDGDIDEEDYAAIAACDGVDVSWQIPLSEPADYDLNGIPEPDIEFELPDAATIEALERCRPLDLTGDGLVDYQDRNVLEASGPLPGPSGIVNRAPVAIAPADYAMFCGLPFVVDAAGSFDPDGDAITCKWSSPTCNILTPDECDTTGTCGPGGIHTVTLEISDGTQSSFDEVLIDYEECSPGRIGDTLRLGKNGSGDPYLDWDESCSASQGYAVYVADLADPTGVLFPEGCGIGTPPTSASSLFANSIYLVVPQNQNYEGSFGVDSDGAERPFPNDGFPRCRQNQALATCSSDSGPGN